MVVGGISHMHQCSGADERAAMCFALPAVHGGGTGCVQDEMRSMGHITRIGAGMAHGHTICSAFVACSIAPPSPDRDNSTLDKLFDGMPPPLPPPPSSPPPLKHSPSPSLPPPAQGQQHPGQGV